MRIKDYFKKITLFSILLLGAGALVFGQNLREPRAEKLLNGMKLLIFSDVGAAKSSVKLRIHSGSAFDPQTKEGVMTLLADILYPTETAREYFEEDLGGSLEITSNYDYIQINATGDNDKILDILESLANAVSKPQIDKDTTAKVKAARIEKVKELEKDPAYVADQAVAKRLFGNFPYGRAQLGTSESLAKIDFADILFAKQKFLTADNATLAVSGNVKSDLVFRAVRRLFGSWEKADKKIPAAFTVPDAPDTKPLIVNSSGDEFRMATEGLARNDKDFFAAQILAKIHNSRFADFPLQTRSFMVRGIFVASGKPPAEMSENQKSKLKQEEFDKAKAEVLAELNQKNVMDFWLDLDTYKLASVKDEFQKANAVTLADAQRIFDKIQAQPIVFVTLTTKPAETNSKND
jgi:hypothetical protein